MRKVSFLPVDHAPELPAGGPVPEAWREAVARHFEMPFALPMENGRAAIAAVLRHLQLTPTDEVYITTSFEYPNVSSCVTCTVFNFCKPSRVLTEHTKAILVIHEFGVPHPRLAELVGVSRERGIPLIEDCAHTVASFGRMGMVGRNGDWVVVSFPKVLAVETGGMLLGRSGLDADGDTGEWQRNAAAWWPSVGEQGDRRRAVFHRMAAGAAEAGLAPAVRVDEDIVPWFFPVAVSDTGAALASIRAEGVDCGHWHGTNLVVLPCHQFLTGEDVDRVVGALRRAAQVR